MPETPLTERQESLLSHLESIYLLAQTVSPDAETAARLVEAAYTQAFVTLPLSNPVRNEKRWLFRLLVQIRHEQAESERLTVEKEANAEAPPAVLSGLRRRLARQIADRALPTVLTTLSDEQRLILLLCDAEDLSCEDAGFVLDFDAESTCQRLEQARAAVNDTLRTGVSEQERHLLDQNLPGDWLRPALRRTAEAEFDLPPSALRHAVVAATRNTSAKPEPTSTLAKPESTLAKPEPPSALPATVAAPASAEDNRRRPRVAPPKRSAGARLRRLLVVVLLVTAIAAIGYLASQSLDRAPETNLITL